MGKDDVDPRVHGNLALKPVEPITLEWHDGSKWMFTPRVDITPQELAMCQILLTQLVLTTWKGGPLDWMGFAKQNNLMRHFLCYIAPKATVIWPDHMA